MKWNQNWKLLRKWWQCRPTRKPLRRSKPTLRLESLEDRTVPTVLFAPQYGAESQLKDGGLRINSPNVYVVFWGNWAGVNSGIQSAADSVILGHYLDGLSQYGVTTHATLAGAFVDPSVVPAGFNGQTIANEIQNNLIAKHLLPDPSQTPNMVIDMVTLPGVTSGVANAAGFNNAVTTTKNKVAFGFIWNGTSYADDSNGGNLSEVDAYSLIFSHELAEVMTDPGTKGYEVNPGSGWTGGTLAVPQIGDYEGNSYRYRMSDGTLVQPYWSAGNGTYPQGWLVTDGQADTANVTPNWQFNPDGSFNRILYDVTINGDQAKTNDHIQVFDALSGDARATVINMNNSNSVFEFDDNSVNTITLNPLTGNNTVEVDSLSLPKAPPDVVQNDLIINGDQDTAVTFGQGIFPVGLGIGVNDATSVNVGNGNLSQFQALLSIHGPNVQTALTLDDHSDPNSLFAEVGTSQVQTVNDFINFDAGRVSSLTIDANKGWIILGNAKNPLQQLPGNITVAGGGNVALTIDGSQAADDSYAITDKSVKAYERVFQHNGFVEKLTNTVHYSGLANLYLDGNLPGSSIFQVQSTAANTPLTLVGGLGRDLFTIGDASDPLDNILGPVNIIGYGGGDILTIDDSGQQVVPLESTNYEISTSDGVTGQVNRQESYTLIRGKKFEHFTFSMSVAYTGVGSVNMLGGPSPAGVLVQGTAAGAPVSFTAGSGGASFQVGDATHSLDNLSSAITLNGNGTQSPLVVNDTASTTAQADDIYLDHLDHGPSGGELGMPVYYSNLASITFDTGGANGNGVAVHGSAANVPVNVFGHAGVQEEFGADTFDAGGLPVAFLSPVAFHGADPFSFGFYYDNLDTTPGQTYTATVDPNDANRELVQQNAESMVSYDGVDAVILTTAGAGGGAINLRSLAPGISFLVGGDAGDVMTVGSQAPKLGGSLAKIKGSVAFDDGGTGTLIVDDSADTQARNVTIDPPPPNDPTNLFTAVTGLTPTDGTDILWDLPDGSPVTLLGGGGGNSFVVHGSIPNVALTINGGSGNDLLIAGDTAATLIGGAGNNIIIAGTTDYDYNPDAIKAIMGELIPATDATFAGVVTALETGANGLPVLDASTVHDNGLTNSLTGGTNLDWYFAASIAQVTDFKNGDFFTSIQ